MNNTLLSKNIVILWLVMLLLIYIIYYVRTKKPVSKEVLKGSRELFIIYLDQFYISNKIITFNLFFIYIFGYSLIFIMLRYAYLGHINSIGFLNSNVSIWPILSNYIQIVISIILYKLLLDLLFKKEINKSYLYFMSFSWYNTFYTILNFKIAEYFLGCIRLVCYRIATLTYEEDMYPLNTSRNPSLEYIHNNEDEYVINNKTFINIMYKTQALARKYLIIKKLFIFIAYILRFLHVHITGLNQQLPYFILFMTFFIEFYNHEIKYLYIISFLVLLIRTKTSLVLFINKRSLTCDYRLRDYFYKNNMAYALQRLSFFQDKEIVIQKLISSRINKSLYFYQSEIVDYIYNNFISILYNVPNKRRFAGMYRRYLTIISFLFIATYILCYKSYTISVVSFPIPLILVFIPLLIIIYSGYQTYHPSTYEEDPSNARWVYSRKNNIIFWVIVALQIYIFWILLFKPVLIFPNTEILFDHLIRITKIYTIEDKIMYIYQYFDYYIQSTLLTVEEQDLLRDKLRQINFQEIINETITLKDIKMNIRAFIATEYYRDHVIIIEKIMELYTEKENSWYNLLRNILIISGISTGILKTISYYDSLLTVLQGLQDVDGIGRISHEVGRIFYKHANQYEFKFHLFDLFGNANKYQNTIYLSQIFETKLSSLLDILLYYGLDTIPLQVRIILTGIIAGFVSTIVLPRIIHFFEKPVLIESKVNIIFLDDMSTIAVIAPYNLYYYCFGVTFLMVISALVFIKKAQMKLHMKDKDYRKS
jgi:hypothetical protein